MDITIDNIPEAYFAVIFPPICSVRILAMESPIPVEF
jgi:hypothetical protein